MASSNAEGSTGALERRAGALLGVMAAAALGCVAVGVALPRLAPGRWAGSAEPFFATATAMVVLAPLVSLLGVALGALTAHRRLALVAAATLGITLIGMAMAR